MIKTIKPFMVVGLFVTGMSVASASAIVPGSGGWMADFEDGSVGGWTAGRASEDEGVLPSVVSDGGNKYLEFQAHGNEFGRRSGPNRRMAFFNKTTWTGDFSHVSEITGDFKATSGTENALYLRLNFEDHNGVHYSSKDFAELNTDGVWSKLSFSMKAEDYFVQHADDEFGDIGEDFHAVDAAQFAAAIAGVHEFKFVSNQEFPQWSGVDSVEAVIGMDNLATAANVSAVPVPAAAWLMMSGLLGLGGFSKKQRKA